MLTLRLSLSLPLCLPLSPPLPPFPCILAILINNNESEIIFFENPTEQRLRKVFRVTTWLGRIPKMLRTGEFGGEGTVEGGSLSWPPRVLFYLRDRL